MRHVMSDPDFLNGKPHLSGVRLSLELILNEFVQKKSVKDIVRKYPQLTHDDVIFVLHYAIRLINAHPEDADPPRKVLP
jgi:uncharacterized protein (DUF433 family)